ncbi:MAG: xanthine dehydrogenase family protein subunit M [Myxococcales bacterium]|nr:xanthine dehydrogenase family protein subunit M [Myxococcales bacterium]
MTGYSPDYHVETPANLAEALEKLAAEPGKWRPLAGGTDLMVLFDAGMLRDRHLLNIARLRELRGIEASAHEVRIGALATYTEIKRDELLAHELPMLGRAARESGAIAIQNRGTIGGNIVNASPAADTPPALLAYGAQVELVSLRGSRTVDYAEFHSGYKTMDLAPDELLLRVRIPRDPRLDGALHDYRKVGTRRAQAISKVALAAVGRVDSGRVTLCRLGMASVAPVPARMRNVEGEIVDNALSDEVIDRAVAAVDADISPIDDVRSTRGYRLQVSKNLVRSFLLRLREHGDDRR